MKTPSYLLLRAIIASQFAITYVAAQGNDFDNYLALPAEPEGFEIVDVRIVGGQLVTEFLSKPLWHFAVDRSADPADWSDEVTDGGLGALADQTTFSIAALPGASLFFRIGEL